MKRKEIISHCKKIVIKVGTSTLTHSNGLLNIDTIEKLVRSIVAIQNRGYEVILVSSGAIGAGMGSLNLSERPATIPEKQAVAAVGQVALIHLYQKMFSEYGKNVAQLLLIGDDFADRKRFLNARNMCFELLKKGVIPIINENDSVVTEEIKVGDNDTLSALVTTLIDANLLIILSDIDGLYTADPRKDSSASLIPIVEEIGEDIKAMAKGVGSKLGTGGMATKIKAATIATSKGSNMIIANGENPRVIRDIIDGIDVGTLFTASKETLTARKHWIKYGSNISGKLVLDSGAIKAIKNGKSLLPSGVVAVDKEFNRGDIIALVDRESNEIALGIANYPSNDILRIMGKNSKEIERVLGYINYEEIVHRNNMYSN